jgi:membrane protein implicated in regulation of membrane protease activity
MDNWQWWGVLAGILVAVEMGTGTVYLLMLAGGAVAGAITAAAGSSLQWQIVCSAVVGAGATLAWHKLRKRKPSSAPAESNPDMNMDVGQVVHVEEWGANKACRVSYRGSDWDIEFQGAGEPTAGSYVIRSVVGNRLIVSPLVAG